jgi:hypothetical protein
MKKQILLATAAVLVSGSVFATKARMQALGQNADGSWLLDDTRNVFYNTSSLNGMKDYVVVESGTVGAADSENAPSAEGGFFRSHGDLSYGAYMGRTGADNAATAYGTEATAASATVAAEAGAQAAGDQLDLFISGDMGVEWGARLSYANASDEKTNAHEVTRSSLGLGLGMTMGDLSTSLNLDISDKTEGGSTNANSTWEADLGMDLNVDYRMGSNTFHLGYDKSGFENTLAGTLEAEGSYSVVELGWGRVMEVSSTSRWFTQAMYTMQTREVTDKNGGTNTSETKSTMLPVTIGFESDATSWLTLRGSISQNVLIGSTETETTGATTNGKSVSDVDTTAVNLGASLNFGKLMVDGVIGTDGSTNTGRLNLDQVMTRVGVHYWF